MNDEECRYGKAVQRKVAQLDVVFSQSLTIQLNPMWFSSIRRQGLTCCAIGDAFLLTVIAKSGY